MIASTSSRRPDASVLSVAPSVQTAVTSIEIPPRSWTTSAAASSTSAESDRSAPGRTSSQIAACSSSTPARSSARSVLAQAALPKSGRDVRAAAQQSS